MTHVATHEVTLWAGPADGRVMVIPTSYAWISVWWSEGEPNAIYVRDARTGRFRWCPDGFFTGTGVEE